MFFVLFVCNLTRFQPTGHLLDELEAQHILDRTFFFFSCDNGYHLGQQRLPPGKREIFEHDINVALIVSGPGRSKSP